MLSCFLSLQIGAYLSIEQFSPIPLRNTMRTYALPGSRPSPLPPLIHLRPRPSAVRFTVIALVLCAATAAAASPANATAVDGPTAWGSVLKASTCSAVGDCGRSYQGCCAAFAIKGFPCGCHLQDGTGTSGANCGDCGTAYATCCIGFAAKGYPCTCDVA